MEKLKLQTTCRGDWYLMEEGSGMMEEEMQDRVKMYLYRLSLPCRHAIDFFTVENWENLYIST